MTYNLCALPHRQAKTATVSTMPCSLSYVQRVQRAMHVLLLVLSISLLFACARTEKVQDTIGASPKLAEHTWQAYQAYALQHYPLEPYRIEASLRYSKGNDGHRVVARLWGNNETTLRLDLMAGIGASIAKVEERPSSFLVYAPLEDKAYFHTGKEQPLFSIGVPIPFTLSQLVALMQGRFDAVFSKKYQGNPVIEKNNILSYTLVPTTKKTVTGTLALTPEGLVDYWTEAPSRTTTSATSNGWHLAIAYKNDPSSTLRLPYKLTFTHSKGHKAILLVKERAFPAQPFTQKQLTLRLPQTATLLPLRMLAGQ